MRFNQELLNGSGCASSPDNDLNDDDLKTCGNCTLCKFHLNKSTIFKSTVTNERFSIPKGNFGIDNACLTKNVVYLITCDHCNLQYVGMTTTTLRTRFANHKSSIKNSKHNTNLYYHFLSIHNRNKLDCLKVQIIYHCDNSEDAKETLLTVEEFYMRKLCTLMPFGLNDHITSMNLNLSSANLYDLHSLNTPFFTFPSERRKRGHGHKKYSKKMNTDNLKSVVDKLFDYDQAFQVRDMFIFLRSLSLSTFKLCLENLDSFCENHPAKRSSVLRILLSFGSQFNKPSKIDDESYIYCTIPFVHKVIEEMGIREILKHRDLNAYLPNGLRKFRIRTTFSYGPTVGKKIFNYNKTLINLTNEDLSLVDCDCKTDYSAFVYPPHGHVHTGQLDIVKNEDLRRIMAMGAKFRLTPSVSKTKIWTVIEKNMLNLKITLSKKAKIKEDCLNFWYDFLMKKIKRRFHSFRNYEIESNDIFEQETVKKYLHDFQERFVLVPVDKASNNFAIICKTFYIEVLKKELGVINKNDINGNAVYQPCSFTEEVFYKQQELENKQLGNVLEEDNKYVPLLYWTSKQHKNPYKFRFIAGASHCTNKTISLELSLALRCIKNHFKNYCNVIKKNNGLSYFWSIDNSMEFLQKINDIDLADSVETYDFSTLYTNLPLCNIYDSLEKLIIKMFKNSGSSSILVNASRRKAFWSQNSSRTGYTVYTIDRLLDALKFVLFNTYVKFGDTIFKQILGIPMGGNASPFIADLYLAWNEYNYMYELGKSKTESDKKLAKLLSRNSRYIDDIAVINYLGFGKIAKQIYHPSLVLESSGFGYHFDTFLDLLIRIWNGKFIIGIYHKVDDFNFEVINFPFPTSNIHSETAYNAFYSQLVRFFRLCNNVTDFCTRVRMIREKLCIRGYERKLMYKHFLKFCRQYPVVLKYGVPDVDILWSKTHTTNIKSCNSNDQKTVKNSIKPSSIILEDIYGKNKSQYSSVLKKCQVNLDNIIDFKSNSEVIEESRSISLPVKPYGLNNPRNHCYVNSVLQIIFRVISNYQNDVNFNYNCQGDICKALFECISSEGEKHMPHLKSLLARYDQFFDGVLQRDALECLYKLIDILHKGTMHSIVEFDSSPVDDEFITSLAKTLFNATIKKVLKCGVCNTENISEFTTNLINVYPVIGKSLSEILDDSFQSQVTKICLSCSVDTLHNELSCIEHHPNILVIAINRFHFGISARKMPLL